MNPSNHVEIKGNKKKQPLLDKTNLNANFISSKRTLNHKHENRSQEKSKKMQKAVHFANTETINDENKVLRKRKVKNYAELSIGPSLEISSNLNSSIKKRPIYFQEKSIKQAKIRKDPFEFVPEPSSKKKKESLSDSDSDSIIYDKAVHEDLKLFRKRIAKKVNEKKKNINKQVDNRKDKNYQNTVLNKNKIEQIGRQKNRSIIHSLTKDILRISRRIMHVRKRNSSKVIEDGTDSFLGFVVNPKVTAINSEVSKISKLGKFTSLTSTPIPNISSKKSKAINIISNLLLIPRTEQDSDSNDSFEFGERYNSQMPSDAGISPWRGDDAYLKRNPHWLAVKDTSLPCYNQEMILNPELLEKPEIFKKQSVLHESCKDTTLVQSSILDFINSSNTEPIETIQNNTLFDNDTFSPIKIKASDNSKKSRSKRNILGDISLNVSTDDTFDVENYFGFDCNDENQENNENLQNRNKPLAHNNRNSQGPMRIHVQQVKKYRDEVAEKLLNKIDQDRNIKENINTSESRAAEMDTKEEKVHQIGLFEDLEEVKPVHNVYQSKRRRRVRLLSVNSEPCEEQEERPKRKRKDVRTPAEEEEFEKWAAAFNAMCEEVDKHTLETV